MVYRNYKRVSKGNGVRIFLTVAVFSIIGIGVFSYITNPIQTDSSTTQEPVTYSATNNPDLQTYSQSTAQSQQSSPTQISNQIQIDPITLEHQIHDQINIVRHQNGLSSLIYDEKVAEVARSHSQDMVVNNYFDHTSPDGKTVQNRFMDAKVICNPAENIEQAIVGDSPQSIVQLWVNSPGHIQNILGFSTTEGIGVYVNGQSVFITEDFC